MSIRWFNANNAAFLGVTIAFGAVALAMVNGHFGEWRDADCQVYPVQTVPSPSGMRRAIHEQEACSSTDQLRTTVVVRTANPSGRTSIALVFASTTGDALGLLSVGQRSLPLVLRWTRDDELAIVYPANVKPELSSVSGGDVKVKLEPTPSRAGS